MKKILIAAVIVGAVAAPKVFADVSIAGVVEQIFVDDDSSNTGWSTSTMNMLNFSASEDLGDSVTAFAKYNFMNMNGQTGNGGNGDNVVGISGDFGTVILGTMEDFTEGKAMSRLDMNGPAEIEATNNNIGRTAGGIAYISPAVSGLTFGVMGYTDASTTGSNNIDVSDMMIHYVNGSLDIILTQEKQAADGSLTTSSETDQTTAVMGVSYAIGDIKVGVVSIDTDGAEGVSADDSTDTALRLDYTMGNNVISIASINDESKTAGAASEVDIAAVEVKHNLSSRTNIYAGYQSHETASNDKSYVGLVHKF